MTFNKCHGSFLHKVRNYSVLIIQISRKSYGSSTIYTSSGKAKVFLFFFVLPIFFTTSLLLGLEDEIKIKFIQVIFQLNLN